MFLKLYKEVIMRFFGTRKPRINGIIGALELGDWYLSLTPEQQEKLRKYSGQGNTLIRGTVSISSFYPPYTQKRFLEEVASNALHEDPDFAILVGKKGLTANGKWIDQHFLYNTVIEAFVMKKDYKSAKEYCLDELKHASQIQAELTATFDGKLPPSLPFRDTLIDIVVNVEKNYTEAKSLVETFVREKLLSQEESAKILQEIKTAEIKDRINKLFEEENFDEGILAIDDEIKELDNIHISDIYKMMGNLLLDKNKEKEAFEYFRKAQTANPLISGVENKIKRLSKKLGIELDQSEIIQKRINILQEKEKSANNWWSKRNLANEYVKIKQFDKAWSLYNESLLLAAKEGISGEGIYRYMAKMLEKEKKYKNALFYYLITYMELLKYDIEPPKYITQGIDRCLKKLDIKNITRADLYDLVKRTRNTLKIRDALETMLKNQ